MNGSFKAITGALAFALLASCTTSSGVEDGQAFTKAQINAEGPNPAWSSEAFAPGRSTFIFDDWAGPAIPVHAYVPAGVDRQTAPILIMLHGAKRGARRYLMEWAPHAEREGFVVIAPLFDRDSFPGSPNYNLGRMFRRSSEQMRDEAEWTFSVIEPLFDHVREQLGSRQESYVLSGHSAGSQFVHRFLFLKPDARAHRVMAANAGWYTMPDLRTDWPYGLAGVDVNEEQLRAALAKDVWVLLGDADSDPNHESLNRSELAMAQGPHRFARGKSFFAAARDLAREKGWEFGWQMRVVPGVAHSNGEMATAAADLVE